MDKISGTGEHNGRPIQLGAADHLIAAEGKAFALAIEDRQVAAYRAQITVGADRIARPQRSHGGIPTVVIHMGERAHEFHIRQSHLARPIGGEGDTDYESQPALWAVRR